MKDKQCYVFGSLGSLICGIIIATIALVLFLNASAYSESDCLVTNSSIKPGYQIYTPTWKVNLTINNGMEVTDHIESINYNKKEFAQKKLEEYAVNCTYDCYYYTTKSEGEIIDVYVTWDKPNKVTPIILFSVGGILCLPILLLLICMCNPYNRAEKLLVDSHNSMKSKLKAGDLI